jgi:hypothetical protein
MSTHAPSVPRLFSEETTVEREVIEHLQGKALGWAYRSREEILAQRGHDEREVLLLPVLREKLKQLKPGGAHERGPGGRHRDQAAGLPGQPAMGQTTQWHPPKIDGSFYRKLLQKCGPAR